ncbi:hypothetical protein BZG05_13030 [Salinivibrio kushneri]|uniref:phage nozzle protein n=1 Tax=Salinivibrio kushneri TaxID=1908198 RepID=UPI000988DD5F|nr:hypothetical protein [Salinivibrio kushneri]OOE32881.1 hypothetical protein BZG05_13030 [Salinivibrio kushneri]
MMDMKTHFMLRDSIEQYVYGVSDGQLHVYDLRTGYSYPVKNTPEYYLDSGSTPEREAFKFLSLGDDTYILNTTVPVQMDYTKLGDGNAEVKKERYRINLRKTANVANTVQENTVSYTKTEIKGGQIDAVLHVGDDRLKVNLDYNDPHFQQKLVNTLRGNDYKAWQENRTTVFEVPVGTPVSVDDYSTIDVEYSYYYDNGTNDMLVDTFQPDGYKYTTRTYTHQMLHVHPHGKSVVVPKTETPVAYVWIKQTDYAVTYTVTLNGRTSQIETPEATSNRARAGLNTEKLTQDLASKINASRGSHGCVAEVWNTVIKIYHGTGSDFDIEVTDGLYNAALKMAKGAVQSKKELPPYASEETIIRVAGETDSENNGYYVRFKQEGGVWEETVKHGLANHIDAKTMPHIIRRLQDFQYVNDDNPYGIYFDVEPVEWSPRAVGDENTVTVPSFVSEQDEEGNITASRYITTMAFYRGRLWFLGGDYASSSVVNDRHNFFQSTAILLSDDDPIDGFIDLTEHAETIHSATPTDSGLLVFTSRAQYLITSQGLLSPITFEFKQVSTYASDSRVTPQPISDRVAFITQRSDYAALQESFVLDTLMQRSASDLTSHVPEYVHGNVHNILASSTVNTMFLIMRDLQGNAIDTVYVYDFLRDGNKRVQSSWSKWQFQGQVVDGVLTQEAVYFIIRRQHFYENEEGEQAVDVWYNMERVDLVTDEVRNELGHPVFLDALQVSDEEPQDLKQGEAKKRFKGKWYRGYPYQQYYKFSPFYLRPQNSKTGETGGRLQLRRLTLNFDKTTSFHLTVQTLGREKREIFFQGRVLGDVRNIIGKVPVVDGKRTFPLLGSSESISVSIRNDSVFDARFQSGYWEGVYHNRARRF